LYSSRVRTGPVCGVPVELLSTRSRSPSCCSAWVSQVILTGLLHDVLEDTDVTAAQLRERFGPAISRRVQALTEDPSITKYRKRKAALRRQILDSSPDVSVVSLADKIAKLRDLDKPPAARKAGPLPSDNGGVEKRYGQSPLSEQLRGQLARWR
jgi:hypothetical protein